VEVLFDQGVRESLPGEHALGNEAEDDVDALAAVVTRRQSAHFPTRRYCSDRLIAKRLKNKKIVTRMP
jgi:hypothetical protein